MGILDEPTNYLDRDGLGALVRGLEAYKGGVVIISHNTEFTDSVCQQKWVMSKHEVTGSGRLREEGAPVLDEEVKNTEGPDEIIVKKKMQAKDIKRRSRILRKSSRKTRRRTHS